MSDPLASTDAALPRARTVVPELVQVHFDGACEPPHAGIATYGFTVEGAGLDHEEFGLAVAPWSAQSTNNVAEYVGAIRALEWLAARSFRGHVLLCGDSQLVIRQMRGEYEVRAEHLRAYHDRLGQLVLGFGEVTYHWVPREENVRADALSKQALRAERAAAQRVRSIRRPETARGSEP